MELKDFFKEHPNTAVAFSGGTDSAYLLYAAAKYGRKTAAYFARTQFIPENDIRCAERFAEEIGVPLIFAEIDMLNGTNAAKNDALRCYYCKRDMMSELKKRIYADGFDTLADGTNASDNIENRPGYTALQELGVLSPLRLCGITKDDVRRLSKEAGLSLWDKPSFSCLATKIPAGTPITADGLEHVKNTFSFS